MDFLYYFLAIFYLALFDISLGDAGSCTLKAHAKCAGLIDQIERDGACQQLEMATDCVMGLVKACGLGVMGSNPLCPENYDSYCDIMDGSFSAPMSTFEPKLTICDVYLRLDSCGKNKCSKGENLFLKNINITDQSVDRFEKSDCPRKAFKKCLSPVLDTTDVTKESCIEVGAAKTCYLDQLDYCDGAGEQQLRADVMVTGLVSHVRQCKEKGFGFAPDGGICAPNPVDTLVTEDYEDIILSSRPTENIKKICQVFQTVHRNYMEYKAACNVSSYNRQGLASKFWHLSDDVLDCYNELGLNKGSNCHLSNLVDLLASVTFVSIFNKLFWN